jgi:hypothetical protein
MLLTGVDYHPSFQTIAFFDEETGELGRTEADRKIMNEPWSSKQRSMKSQEETSGRLHLKWSWPHGTFAYEEHLPVAIEYVDRASIDQPIDVSLHSVLRSLARHYIVRPRKTPVSNLAHIPGESHEATGFD